MQQMGLYVHVPFCVSKCPYCDFYSSSPADGAALDAYTEGMVRAMERWSRRLPYRAHTLYFGGGTPTLLGGRRLAALIDSAHRCFRLFDGAAPEITLEANPAEDLSDTLAAFAAAGGNRLSVGMQSCVPRELHLLGRRHTPADVERTVGDARRAGIGNVSLDVMLGISGQTVTTALQSVERAADLGATHLSAYMLKLEPGTPYGVCPPPLPDEDSTAELYLAAMERAEQLGYRQYEISNAALPGFESRHNTLYWDSRPYLGLGPAASSCIDGRRFTFPRDTARFLAGGEPTEDPEEGIPVGSPEEYALLRLRLSAGLQEEAYRLRFGGGLPAAWRQQAASLPGHLVVADEAGIRLTREGFLLSNTLISHILAK